MAVETKPKVWISVHRANDAMAHVPEAIVGKLDEVNRPRVKVRPPIVAYKTGLGMITGNFNKSEYDLAEIAKARDTEAYVRLAFDQLKSRILREPWTLKGRNNDTVAYIITRIREMELASNVSFNMLIRQVVMNLVSTCNAFIVKVRDGEHSSGAKVRRYGRDLAPVAAIFSADPSSMEAKRAENGVVERWRQQIPGKEVREFPAENVVHIAYDRNDGFLFGTPWIVPVLDDIRALRRIEELVEMLIGRHLFPLYHYAVGTENNPAQEYDDGSSEVDIVRAAIEGMPSEGCIVTPERHTIQAISPNPLEARPYLDYFEERVHTGLRISNVDSGRGDTSNRATAGFLRAAKDDLAKDMQDVLCDFFTFFIFDELLEEGLFPLTEDNRVYLYWPPIDPEEQRLREAHASLMFQNNAITETEARLRFSMQPITEEQRQETFFELYTKPLAELNAELKMEQQAQAAQLKAVNRPTNQSGTKTARTKPKNDNSEENQEDTLDQENEMKDNNFVPVWDSHEFAMGHIIDSIIVNHGFDALDVEQGEDGLDEQTIREYQDSFLNMEKTLTAAERNRLKGSTFCGPEKSFPIPDCKHYTAGLRLLSRYKGPGDKERIKSCIMSKGRKMKCTGATEK